MRDVNIAYRKLKLFFSIFACWFVFCVRVISYLVRLKPTGEEVSQPSFGGPGSAGTRRGCLFPCSGVNGGGHSREGLSLIVGRSVRQAFETLYS